MLTICNLILSHKHDCASVIIRHLSTCKPPGFQARRFSAPEPAPLTRVPLTTEDVRSPNGTVIISSPQMTPTGQFLLGQPCTTPTAGGNKPLFRLPAFHPELMFLIDSCQSLPSCASGISCGASAFPHFDFQRGACGHPISEGFHLRVGFSWFTLPHMAYPVSSKIFKYSGRNGSVPQNPVVAGPVSVT